MAVTWKEIAFKDEVAALSTATPASVGTAGSAGSGTAASKDDHVHDLGAGCIDASNLFAADVVTGDQIADDAIGSEHIEQLSAALDFGGQQATDMIIMQSAEAPAAPVVGKIYQDSDDQKLFICTSAA